MLSTHAAAHYETPSRLSARLECGDKHTIGPDDMAFIMQLAKDNMLEMYVAGHNGRLKPNNICL